MTPAQKTALEGVTTATLTTVLLKKGVRFCYIAGSRPIVPGATKRIVGPAFTLRFTPTREDLATVDSWSSPRSTRAAIEEMPEGCVAVADAMGSTAAAPPPASSGTSSAPAWRRRAWPAWSPTACCATAPA